MSLIQRNAVPLFILLAVVAVGLGALFARSPFAFGEEPAGCDTPGVGISINTTDSNGVPVNVVNHGDVITYGVNLSVPELPAGKTACNFSGGSLTITLPNGETTGVAGTSETPAIPGAQVGAVFESATVQYTVNQGDATNKELSARADYSGGQSHSVPEGEAQPEAAASQSNIIRIRPPALSISKTTTTDEVFQGNEAVFQIIVSNDGGYELSNVQVTDEEAPACDRSFDTLAVGQFETIDCGVRPVDTFDNIAVVTANVDGGVPDDESTLMAQSDPVRVIVRSAAIALTILPLEKSIRVGTPHELEITVIGSEESDLTDINVTVTDFPECDGASDSLARGSNYVYNCTVEDLPTGTTVFRGQATAEVTGLAAISANTQAEVLVVDPALIIEITPVEPTIREGTSATFNVKVGNFGDSALTNVSVTSAAVPGCDNSNFPDPLLPEDDPENYQEYQCTSDALFEDLAGVATVSGTALDGADVEASSETQVTILRPSTSVGLEELSTQVLRLVVQTLKVTETNDGDSALTDICVELDTTGSILPLAAMAMMEGEGMMEEGEAMEGEAMEEDAMMMESSLCAGSDHELIILTKDSIEFVGGDIGDDGIMDVGETWEWRVVTVGVAGNFVPLSEDAVSMNFVAVGHGLDTLGGDVTYPGDAEELAEIEIPIVVGP